jgi:glycosyltransferase involved in cell wall biosynthesis
MKCRIGLEASSLLAHRLSGIQRYILELATALANLTEAEPELRFELCFKISRIRKASLRPESQLKQCWYWPLPGFSIRGYDLFHALDTTLPWPLPDKLVCTIHDLFSIIVEDYSREHFRKKKIRSYQRVAENCSAIIVPSNTTKQDLLNNLDYPEGKIFIVPHGVSPLFFHKINQRHGHEKEKVFERPYIVAFGGRERKNLSGVVRAFSDSVLAENHLLVVIGRIETEASILIKDNGLENKVLSLGNVGDTDLAEIYRNASMLCFPSLYEGFGLPVLEAMAAEIPVVTSNIGAAAEVGLNHAVLVDPKSVSAISMGMENALKINKDMLQQAREYAKGFTWEKTARQTLTIYKTILAS